MERDATEIKVEGQVGPVAAQEATHVGRMAAKLHHGEPKTFVQDPQEAYAMAIASGRYEQNFDVYTSVANDGIYDPGNPENRVAVYGRGGVSAVPGNQAKDIGETYSVKTIGGAIAAAREERRLADEKAKQVSEEYRQNSTQLQDLLSKTRRPYEP